MIYRAKLFSPIDQLVSFLNQHYLVTGATGGIGKEVVYELLKEGAFVSAVGRNKRSLDELREHLEKSLLGFSRDWQERLYVIDADLSTQKGCEKCVTDAKNKKELYGLIHCAGVGMRALARDVSVDTFEQVMAVNFNSLFYLYRAAREDLVTSKGQVAAISSVQAYIALPGRSAYVAAKHALHGFMKSLRLEEPEISFLTVTAGYIRTEFSAKALARDGRQYGKSDTGQKKGVPPDVAARKILQALQKRKREIIVSGIKERLAIFIHRRLPALYERIARGYAP